MRFQIRQPAGAPGDDWTRFAPTAWDSQIGKVVPVHVDGSEQHARLIAASVIDDGAAVLLTLETLP